jgi:hypothetical protein
MAREWTISGRRQSVDEVDDRLKKEMRIQADKTADQKLIVKTKNAGEDNKIIEIVHDAGARLVKDSAKVSKAERKERKEAKRERNERKNR